MKTITETTLAARRKSRGDDALDEQEEEEKEEDEGEIKEDRDDDDDTVARYQRQKRTSCVHEVAIPKSLRPSAMELYRLLKAPTFSSEKYAKKYAFELDAFQSTAVAVLERGESVMVAAHTSAGKAVVLNWR